MDTTIAAPAGTNPVFILPGALNACAEEAGRALVELLLAERAMPGPVFVIDGDGLVDLRETIAESMHGRAFASERPWRAAQLAQQADLLRLDGCSVIGEGLATDAAMAAPLFVEMTGASLAAGAPPPPGAGRRGVLVRCRDALELLTLAAAYARAPACYVQAGGEDAPLAKSLALLLDRPPTRLTISAASTTAAWLAATASF